MKQHVNGVELFTKIFLLWCIVSPIIVFIYLANLWGEMKEEQVQKDAEWNRRHHTTTYYSTQKKSSGSSSYSNSSKSTGSHKSSGGKSNFDNGYDEGYDDVYDNEDYDWDRYLNDDDYALGVDDAMDELDW